MRGMRAFRRRAHYCDFLTTGSVLLYNLSMSDLYRRYMSISLFKHAAERAYPLAAVFACDDEHKKLEFCADVFRAVAESGARSTGEWLTSLVECDDNAFSRAAAGGERINDCIKRQVEKELATFKLLSRVSPADYAPDGAEYVPAFETGGFNMTYGKLCAFYLANGCGALALGDAFTYTEKGFASVQAEPVSLSDLKNYDEEKAEIVRNTQNFAEGLPAFHALLYGDRGTGKSTTVRAVCAQFKGKLKTVQLAAERIELLPELLEKLSPLKQKFIVFIDDLVFDENDGRAEGFKAALEGSLAGRGNALIYCTSNRRHLFKETDKQGLKNRNDEVQAELALFDRFGLVITYIAPDKDGFLDIFKQILLSRGIKWRDEYASVAELAALKKGGRTPRAAKQIADLIQSTYAEMR